VYFLKQKLEVFRKFKVWTAELENQKGRKVEFLRSDNEREYTSSEFKEYLASEDIKHQLTITRPPEQNRVAGT